MDPDAGADTAAAIAQAMGFSSFGAQDHHPQKRRKYNAAADSITSASTGSNSTPLGAPSPKPKPAADSVIAPDHDEADAPSQEPREPPRASMPAHPPAGRGGFVGGASSGSHATRGRRVERRHNEPWYTGYYDGTSNENPWERLEKVMGLRTRGGTWVPRSSWTPATT